MLPSNFSFKLLSREEAREAQKSHIRVIKKNTRRTDAGVNKKSFLKLLGLVGLGFVVSSFFPKKADALVFGSTPTSNVVGVKDSTNVRINPATNEKLDDVITALGSSSGYKVSDIDETGTTNYFGFVSSSGTWYITAYDTSANTFRYIKGDSDYTTSWTARASLVYGYYDVIF